jgi:hypothetical protein
MRAPPATEKDSRNRLWMWTIRVGLLVLGVLGLGLLVLAILGLVGQLSTPVGPIRQHLTAADFASSAVAGATLMLAVFTAYLAMETRASVAATRREANIAEQTLIVAKDQARATVDLVAEAQVDRDLNWRPYLMAVTGFAGAPNSPDALRLKNVGRGPAFDCVYARYLDKTSAWKVTGRGQVPIVAAGDQTEQFMVGESQARPAPTVIFEDQDNKMWGSHVALFYRDLLGKRAYRLLPPRAMPDVWSPGDPVDQWVAWYFGWIHVQVPNPR